MTLEELAARCEAAMGADRELDARIRAALYAPEGATIERSPINGAWCVYSGTDRSGRPRLFYPSGHVSNEHWSGAYTTSIDAALTLVPKGAEWTIQNNKPKPMAIVTGTDRYVCATTPALALCAAALRARQETDR